MLSPGQLVPCLGLTLIPGGELTVNLSLQGGVT